MRRAGFCQRGCDGVPAVECRRTVGLQRLAAGAREALAALQQLPRRAGLGSRWRRSWGRCGILGGPSRCPRACGHSPERHAQYQGEELLAISRGTCQPAQFRRAARRVDARLELPHDPGEAPGLKKPWNRCLSEIGWWFAADRKAAPAVDTRNDPPHKPALPTAGVSGSDVRHAMASGGVSRVAKGADCKSAGLRLRRFESYLPHQPGSGAFGVRQPGANHPDAMTDD